MNSWINFLVEVLKNVLNSPPSFQLQMRSLRLLCITLGSTEVYKQEINVNNLLEGK